jgi:hypothetical protein
MSTDQSKFDIMRWLKSKSSDSNNHQFYSGLSASRSTGTIQRMIIYSTYQETFISSSEREPIGTPEKTDSV